MHIWFLSFSLSLVLLCKVGGHCFSTSYSLENLAQKTAALTSIIWVFSGIIQYHLGDEHCTLQLIPTSTITCGGYHNYLE